MLRFAAEVHLVGSGSVKGWLLRCIRWIVTLLKVCSCGKTGGYW